jgi:predicted ArsR family transcriptional regulator
MSTILQYLKSHGEKLDTEIAEATGLSVEAIRIQLTELAAIQEVMVCQSTRFENGKKIESMSGRISGFIPKAAPGRKSSRVNLKLS